MSTEHILCDWQGPVSQTPSIKAGEFIHEVDGQQVYNMSVQEVVQIILGKSGSVVVLTVSDREERHHQQPYRPAPSQHDSFNGTPRHSLRQQQPPNEGRTHLGQNSESRSSLMGRRPQPMSPDDTSRSYLDSSPPKQQNAPPRPDGGAGDMQLRDLVYTTPRANIINVGSRTTKNTSQVADRNGQSDSSDRSYRINGVLQYADPNSPHATIVASPRRPQARSHEQTSVINATSSGWGLNDYPPPQYLEKEGMANFNAGPNADRMRSVLRANNDQHQTFCSPEKTTLAQSARSAHELTSAQSISYNQKSLLSTSSMASGLSSKNVADETKVTDVPAAKPQTRKAEQSITNVSLQSSIVKRGENDHRRDAVQEGQKAHRDLEERSRKTSDKQDSGGLHHGPQPYQTPEKGQHSAVAPASAPAAVRALPLHIVQPTPSPASPHRPRGTPIESIMTQPISGDSPLGGRPVPPIGKEGSAFEVVTPRRKTVTPSTSVSPTQGKSNQNHMLTPNSECATPHGGTPQERGEHATVARYQACCTLSDDGSIGIDVFLSEIKQTTAPLLKTKQACSQLYDTLCERFLPHPFESTFSRTAKSQGDSADSLDQLNKFLSAVLSNAQLLQDEAVVDFLHPMSIPALVPSEDKVQGRPGIEAHVKMLRDQLVRAQKQIEMHEVSWQEHLVKMEDLECGALRDKTSLRDRNHELLKEIDLLKKALASERSRVANFSAQHGSHQQDSGREEELVTSLRTAVQDVQTWKSEATRWRDMYQDLENRRAREAGVVPTRDSTPAADNRPALRARRNLNLEGDPRRDGGHAADNGPWARPAPQDAAVMASPFGEGQHVMPGGVIEHEQDRNRFPGSGQKGTTNEPPLVPKLNLGRNISAQALPAQYSQHQQHYALGSPGGLPQHHRMPQLLRSPAGVPPLRFGQTQYGPGPNSARVHQPIECDNTSAMVYGLQADSAHVTPRSSRPTSTHSFADSSGYLSLGASIDAMSVDMYAHQGYQMTRGYRNPITRPTSLDSSQEMVM